MQDLTKLENSELVDLLMKVTDRYYKVNNNGTDFTGVAEKAWIRLK